MNVLKLYVYVNLKMDLQIDINCADVDLTDFNAWEYINIRHVVY